MSKKQHISLTQRMTPNLVPYFWKFAIVTLLAALQVYNLLLAKKFQIYNVDAATLIAEILLVGVGPNGQY